MKEIEEMSSEDDEFAIDDDDDDDDDDKARRGGAGNKRGAKAVGRGGKGSKRASDRGSASTFASADDFGAQVDNWHAQLIQVRGLLPSSWVSAPLFRKATT